MYVKSRFGHKKIFFRSKETREYFADRNKKMKEDVEQITDTEINSCNLIEWTNYLEKKYYIKPIILF